MEFVVQIISSHCYPSCLVESCGIVTVWNKNNKNLPEYLNSNISYVYDDGYGNYEYIVGYGTKLKTYDNKSIGEDGVTIEGNIINLGESSDKINDEEYCFVVYSTVNKPLEEEQFNPCPQDDRCFVDCETIDKIIGVYSTYEEIKFKNVDINVQKPIVFTENQTYKKENSRLIHIDKYKLTTDFDEIDHANMLKPCNDSDDE